MKKIFLTLLLFIIFFAILSNFTPTIVNATCTTCEEIYLTCPNGTVYDSNQSCTRGIPALPGKCCVPDTSGTDTGTGTGGTSNWGLPGAGPSLDSISKLLGSGAPNSAPKAGFNSIISLIINLLILAAILLSLLYLIWGGFDWITSGGDKQKLQSARHKVVFAIIGLVIVFLVFFIINTIYYFFGLGGGGPGALPQPPNENIGGK